MADISSIPLNLSITLGQAQMPLAKFLKLGRGAVIRLDPPALSGGDAGAAHAEPIDPADQPLTVRANGVPVAKARVLLRGEMVAVELMAPPKTSQS